LAQRLVAFVRLGRGALEHSSRDLSGVPDGVTVGVFKASEFSLVAEAELEVTSTSGAPYPYLQPRRADDQSCYT